jgi:dihydrodipicolinate reductase
MEKKKIVVVGCSSTGGQQICKELTTSEKFDIVAGFDTMFSTALNYPFKTCVTVDELKSLFISEITTNETTKEGFTTVLLDIIVSSDEMPDDIRAFALKYDIPIVTIKDANEITKALEEYL